MSSTDASPDGHDLEAFLLQAARLGEEMRRQGFDFDRVPAPGSDSYFIQRTPLDVSIQSLMTPACADPGELETRLASLWSSGPHAGLAALAPSVAALAHTLRETRRRDDGNGDVTPFVYAMF